MKPLVLVVAILLAPQAAQSQNAAATPPQAAGALTPAQAQQAIDVLQDEGKRSQLVQTLQAIAKASPPGANAPAAAQPPSEDNLGVQLLVQGSNWLGEVSSALAVAARAVSDLPMVGRWLMQLVTNPGARGTLLELAWKLALVIACALVAEYVVWRAIRKPLAAIERYMPAGARHPGGERPAPDAETALSGIARELRRRPSLAYAWQLILRLPFVLARLALDLLPLVAFAAVGNFLLAPIGSEATSRVVILAIVNAYVLCRGILCVIAALVSPASNQPSLLVIRDETAAYIDIWARRIVIVAVFGVAIANIALVLGLYHSAYVALVRLVVLVVHLFVVVVILQCRRNIADLIRAPEGQRGFTALARNRLAEIWHVPAILLNLALWAVWALQVQNGYMLLVQYCLATVAVLAIARLVLLAVMTALDRIFQISPDVVRRFPGLEQRANRYFPFLRTAVSVFIAIITAIALFEVWGFNATDWFSSGKIGGRIVSALATIAVAAVVAFGIWEAINAVMERHLTRLGREGRHARAVRLRTFQPMLRTALLSVILTVVVLTALSELGVNIAPLLAGAGIVGIAIGFGSQKLVQDLITGVFLLLENAMQVGDYVTVSGLSGVVENLSIRSIRLRASDGSIHIIPFSSVNSVTNTNRGIGNAAISVNVAFKEDTDRVGTVLQEVATEMRRDPAFKSMIRGDLDLWGIDKFDASMVTIAGQIECTDAGRWPVQREFYRRMKKRFQELEIEIR